MKRRVVYSLAILTIFFAGLFQARAEGSGGGAFWEALKQRWSGKKTAREYGKNDPQFTIVHEGAERVYKVHVPLSYDGTKPVPVVIYIHGGAGDMRAAYMDGLDVFSEKYGFILLIPQGTGEVKLGHMRAQWNGGRWESGACCGSSDDVGFIARMIDEVGRRYNIDEKRIYATGISNGGLMVNRLGCELSERIAAIATVAPAAIESNCDPFRPMPVMDIHGTADPANPPDGSEPRGIFAPKSGGGFAVSYKRMTPSQVVAVWKKLNQCSDAYVAGYKKGKAECVRYRDCAQGAEVELCMVEGMGHAYPGGSQYLPRNMVGPVSYDITFDQIWEFFKRHALP